MIEGDEGIERSGAEVDLRAVGHSEPELTTPLRLRLRLGRRLRRQLKECGLVDLRPPALGWSAHKEQWSARGLEAAVFLV